MTQTTLLTGEQIEKIRDCVWPDRFDQARIVPLCDMALAYLDVKGPIPERNTTGKNLLGRKGK